MIYNRKGSEQDELEIEGEEAVSEVMRKPKNNIQITDQEKNPRAPKIRPETSIPNSRNNSRNKPPLGEFQKAGP